MNIAKSLRMYMVSSTGGSSTNFTISMDDSYAFKIGMEDFDPDKVFPETIELSNQLSVHLQHLSPWEEAFLELKILSALARMVYGSNMIERAGSEQGISLKLCMLIFQGKKVPEDIKETSEEFLTLEKELRKDVPVNTSAVLQSRQEIIQHAKAAAFMIDQLCFQENSLSEKIILETHRILCYQVDAEDTTWTEYAGQYRKFDVSCGLHTFPDAATVPRLMRTMLRELDYDMNNAKIDPVALAVKYTHSFVNIHPFVDGNGRICRLILNSLLLKLGMFLVTIGENSTDRSEYLEIAAYGGGLEEMYKNGMIEDDNGRKPQLFKELASFVLAHVKTSLEILMSQSNEY